MKYVALLRGINVGGNNKVPMPVLKELFQDLGYKNVTTYINSGNVLFSANEQPCSVISDAVELAMKHTFGFEVKVLIKTESQFSDIYTALSDDWVNDNLVKTDVMFLWEGTNALDEFKAITLNPQVDVLLFVNGAVIWNIQREHVAKSGIRKLIGSPMYKQMTVRNSNTVRALKSILDSTDDDL